MGYNAISRRLRLGLFFSDLGLTLGALAPLLESTFATLGSLLAHLGCTFSCRNRLGRKRCPERWHPDYLLQQLDAVSRQFLDVSRIFCATCLFVFARFSWNLGSRWAFHGIGSYAICTRVCSPNALPSVCILFQQRILGESNMEPHWRHFGFKSTLCERKWVSETVPKDGSLPDSN